MIFRGRRSSVLGVLLVCVPATLNPPCSLSMAECGRLRGLEKFALNVIFGLGVPGVPDFSAAIGLGGAFSTGLGGALNVFTGGTVATFGVCEFTSFIACGLGGSVAGNCGGFGVCVFRVCSMRILR